MTKPYSAFRAGISETPGVCIILDCLEELRRGLLDCLKKLTRGLFALLRTTPWWLRTAVFIIVLAYMIPERSLVVLPVSVPTTVAANGYSPTAASQVVAAHMARMVDPDRLSRAEQLSRMSGNPPRFSGISDLPDVQVPGQQFSFRGVWRFLRNLLGAGDPTVSISVGHSGPNYIVRATAVGGDYNGRRASARVPSRVNFEEVFLTAAALAVDAVAPLHYVLFLTAVVDGSEDGHCPVGVTCTFDTALDSVASLLADAHQDDDARAHLVYATLSLAAGQTAAALRHCETAAEFKETKGLGLIFCAHTHIANDNSTRAMEIAFTALKVQSDDPDVRARLGNLLLALNSDARAQEAYEAALELDARHVYSLIGLGTIDLRAKRYPQAAEHYQAALVINPNEPYAHGGLGAALVGQGYTVRALLHVQSALDADATYPVAINAKCEALGCVQP